MTLFTYPERDRLKAFARRVGVNLVWTLALLLLCWCVDHPEPLVWLSHFLW